MRQFYEHVRVEAETLHFYVKCEICKKKQLSTRIPMLCRSVPTLARCAKGRANRLSQSLFNHAKAKATQLLAIHFNQCRHCYRWVCDDCYDATDDLGACRECSQDS